MPKQKSPIHEPVLLKEVLQFLKPQAGETYLDVTAGFGGHAAAILGLTKNDAEAVLIDRDKAAVEALQEKFAGSGAQIIYKDYLGASEELQRAGNKFDLILADLGISSLHLDEASRGFSFASSGPLDMRMDKSQDLSAEVIVNNWSEKRLAEILANYGEEPKSRAIARAIVQARPIKTTDELANVVAKFWPGSRRHPATRTFQALRIVVNDEIGQLEGSLPLWLELLKPGGRLGVITFHSLEDRIAKQFFKEQAFGGYGAQLEIVTKRPITATNEEIVSNPRARSAKLRVSRKNKNP